MSRVKCFLSPTFDLSLCLAHSTQHDPHHQPASPLLHHYRWPVFRFSLPHSTPSSDTRLFFLRCTLHDTFFLPCFKTFSTSYFFQSPARWDSSLCPCSCSPPGPAPRNCSFPIACHPSRPVLLKILQEKALKGFLSCRLDSSSFYS